MLLLWLVCAVVLLELNHLENAEKCISTTSSCHQFNEVYLHNTHTMAENIETRFESANEKERKSTIRQNVKEEKRIVFSCDANGIIIHKARPTLPSFNDFELDYVWLFLLLPLTLPRLPKKNTKWWSSNFYEFCNGARSTIGNGSSVMAQRAQRRWQVQKNKLLIETWADLNCYSKVTANKLRCSFSL